MLGMHLDTAFNQRRGRGRGRLIGFEGVTERDDFPTASIERRLAAGSKVITMAAEPRAGQGSIFGFAPGGGADGEGSDSD